MCLVFSSWYDRFLTFLSFWFRCVTSDGRGRRRAQVRGFESRGRNRKSAGLECSVASFAARSFGPEAWSWETKQVNLHTSMRSIFARVSWNDLSLSHQLCLVKDGRLNYAISSTRLDVMLKDFLVPRLEAWSSLYFLRQALASATSWVSSGPKIIVGRDSCSSHFTNLVSNDDTTQLALINSMKRIFVPYWFKLTTTSLGTFCMVSYFCRRF